MPLLRRPALFLTAIGLGVAALGYEPAVLRDFSLEAEGSRLSIGAARVPLWGAALAQTDQIVLENVSLQQGASTYTAKRIVFSGVTSTRVEIEAIFDGGSREPLATRLSRITAKRIEIPELLIESQAGAYRDRLAYHNLVASDVSQGRIATLTAEAGNVEVQGPDKVRWAQKKLTMTGVALADLTRIYFEKAGSQATPAKIYETAVIEDVEYQVSDGPVLRVARGSARDVLMRPTEESWSATLSLAAAMAEIDKPSTAESKRLGAALADLLGAFEIGLLDLQGLEIQGRSEDGEPVSLRLDRIAYTGAAGQPADLRFEGFGLSTKEGRASLATLAFTGFSFRSTLEGIKELSGKPPAEIDASMLRRLIPTIGTMRVSGLDIDAPDEKSKGPIPERIRLSVKDMELTADKPVNGVPTNIRFATRDWVMPLPENSEDEGIKNLLGLGYKSIIWSATTAASWHEDEKEIRIHEISTTAAGMLNFKVSGTIGNVTMDVFNPDTAVAMVAALGATAKRLDVTLENDGFFERYLAQEARKARKSPEALRREYGSAAAIAVPVILGNSEQAKTIGRALAKFVARPTRLRIAARAKNADGVGIADVMSVATPSAILESLEIEAATDEPI
jgi:hypothetical protein